MGYYYFLSPQAGPVVLLFFARLMAKTFYFNLFFFLVE